MKRHLLSLAAALGACLLTGAAVSATAAPVGAQDCSACATVVYANPDPGATPDEECFPLTVHGEFGRQYCATLVWPDGAKTCHLNGDYCIVAALGLDGSAMRLADASAEEGGSVGSAVAMAAALVNRQAGPGRSQQVLRCNGAIIGREYSPEAAAKLRADVRRIEM